MSITIAHTPADGTLVHGTAKGDGSAAILKTYRFRWSRQLGSWYLPQSRDRVTPDTGRIHGARDALQAAGYTVAVEISYGERRSVGEREADRADRAERRAERHHQAADRAAGRAHDRFDTAGRMGDAIPFGQPILAGHHSQRRDENYRARLRRHQEKGVEEARKAGYHDHAAKETEAGQRRRHNPRVIMRRLDDLAAARRKVTRSLDGEIEVTWSAENGFTSQPVKPEGDHLARLQARAADLDERIAYWQGELDAAKADGFREFGPDDVSKDDWVRSEFGWQQVIRVNKKTVTVPAVIDRLAAAGYTDKLPWDKIRDVQPGERR